MSGEDVVVLVAKDFQTEVIRVWDIDLLVEEE
jgi:hypothetical protein